MGFKARFFARAVLGVAAGAALVGVVMVLWNAVVPSTFAGASAIDYWHALGLLALSRILFGGFRGHHRGPPWGHRHEHPRGRHGWRGWRAMTPDEREHLRSGPGRHEAPRESRE